MLIYTQRLEEKLIAQRQWRSTDDHLKWVLQQRLDNVYKIKLAENEFRQAEVKSVHVRLNHCENICAKPIIGVNILLSEQSSGPRHVKPRTHPCSDRLFHRHTPTSKRPRCLCFESCDLLSRTGAGNISFPATCPLGLFLIYLKAEFPQWDCPQRSRDGEMLCWSHCLEPLLLLILLLSLLEK